MRAQAGIIATCKHLVRFGQQIAIREYSTKWLQQLQMQQEKAEILFAEKK
jgi:hypothetical protein